MNDCVECARLREESAIAFSEYLSCKDELAMTDKKDRSFANRRRAYDSAQGRLRECHKRESSHREDSHHRSLPSDEEVDRKIAWLRERIELGEVDGIHQAIFELSPISNGWREVPDRVVEGLLTMLRDDKMYNSAVAAHLLNYFEFESPHLTRHQKSLCVGFLKAHGDRFTDFYSQHVVGELRAGDYLK